METLWSKIKENLQNMLDSGIFNVLVSPLSAEINGDKLCLYAPNNFLADQSKRYLGEMRKAAAPVLNIPAEKVIIDVAVKKIENEAIKKPLAGIEIISQMMPQALRGQGVLPVVNVSKKPEEKWRFRFDDLVTGPSNNMAVAAARDMSECGQVRSLFVNAAPGLGKTHLAQAAGHAMSQSSSALKVAYLTGEQFASRYVAAMRSNDLESYKQYLCNLDVLLLEDVHFLQRKKAMQEMILSVIKNLEDKCARVIMTSSFAPKQLQDMDSQLISYFCSGILTNIGKPDINMRKEILQRKAQSFQVKLPDTVCDILSKRLSSDVRQLESCLKSMIFKAKLLHSGITVDLALETVSQYAGDESAIDLDGIIHFVCESFGISEQQLRSKSRKQDYVLGRNTVFYLARKHTEMSLEEIGCLFNRRHSTVLRNITEVEKEIAKESRIGRQITKAVDLIERKCGIVDKRFVM